MTSLFEVPYSICSMIVRGGGGYWVCATPETPISALNFRSGSYHFHTLPKIPFRSISILHFLGELCRFETIIFKISLISTRSSPATAGSARQHHWLAAGQSASQTRPGSLRETRIFTLKTDPALSGAPHVQAQNGYFRSRGSFFTLPRHVPSKIWGEYPPPRGCTHMNDYIQMTG